MQQLPLFPEQPAPAAPKPRKRAQPRRERLRGDELDAAFIAAGGFREGQPQMHPVPEPEPIPPTRRVCSVCGHDQSRHPNKPVGCACNCYAFAGQNPPLIEVENWSL